MADVRIAGNIIVLTSSVTLEELKRLEKHRPEALEIRNAKDEVMFRVGTGSNALNINGASFCTATLDSRGLALITLTIPAGVTDAKLYFAESFGKAYAQFKRVEAGLAEATREVAAEIAEIMNDVQFSDGATQAPDGTDTGEE
jgi:hypothetical protein